jgi:hypothetical protein
MIERLQPTERTMALMNETLEMKPMQSLQLPLQDIRDKKVDVVVVYKIDRLTRSLTDSRLGVMAEVAA